MMAHFYPEDMMGDLGGFEQDISMMGSAWWQ